MINRRFLNFKTYDAFVEKFDEIDKDNAIVFIQDKRCIWAHNKEYICDGPYKANIDGQTLEFKNGIDDNVAFSITINNGVITLTDGEGNNIYGGFITQQDLNDITQDVSDIQDEFNSIGQNIDSIETSIENLGDNKQNKLSAGYGISRSALENNTIEVTIDGSIYVFVRDLPTDAEANPNKIYIKESVVDGEYVHQQYRLIDGHLTPIGTVVPNVNYEEYIGEALQGYALSSWVSDTFQRTGDYATNPYVNSTFVKISQVYCPTQNGFTTNSGDNQEVNPSDGHNDGTNVNPGGNDTIEPSVSYITREQLEQALAQYNRNTMVTLTTGQYERLVERNLVQPDTYYFTYEGEAETETWGFGDQFPIILTDTNNSWGFGDKFPIVLTDIEKDWEFGDKFPIILTDQWTFGRAFPIKFK